MSSTGSLKAINISEIKFLMRYKIVQLQIITVEVITKFGRSDSDCSQTKEAFRSPEVDDGWLWFCLGPTKMEGWWLKVWAASHGDISRKEWKNVANDQIVVEQKHVMVT